MAASTTDIETPRQDGDVVAYDLGAAKKVNQGTLVCQENTTGYAEAATDGLTKVFCGIAYEAMDNSAGAAAAKKVRCYRKGLFTVKYTGAAPAVGVDAYVSDDQTVTATAGNTKCGRVVRVNTAAVTCDIDIDRV